MSVSHRIFAYLSASALLLGSTLSCAQAAVMGALAAQSALMVSNATAGSISISTPPAASQTASMTEPAPTAQNADAAPETYADYTCNQAIGSSLDEALLQGFSTVIARLSAGAYAPTAEDAAAALKDAKLSDGALSLTFDPAAIEKLLAAQGVALWDGLNNPIIVWMADYSLDKNTLVSGEHMSAFAASLNQCAADYQLRLMYPLMDLDDVTQVNEEVVLAHNNAQLAAASTRYGADFILAAAVSLQDSIVSASWNLLDKNGTLIAQASLDGLSGEVAQTMAGDLARTLAQHQGLSGETAAPGLQDPKLSDAFALGPYQGLVRVKVSGVRSLADLAAIKRTLIIYGYEDSVEVSALNDGALILEIPSNADPAILDGTMARAQDFAKEGPWTYRWLKTTGARAMGDYGTLGARSSRSAVSVSGLAASAAEPAGIGSL